MLAGDGAVTTARAGHVGSSRLTAVRDEGKEFVKRIVGDTEDTWDGSSSKWAALRGAPARAVPRARRVGVRAGELGGRAVLLPGDSQVYLDQSFLSGIEESLRRPRRIWRALRDRARDRASRPEPLGNRPEGGAAARAPRADLAQRPVGRQELQADCFAGVWATTPASAGLLEPGDLESGLNAAASIGDDRLQQQSLGTVRLESFTHGSRLSGAPVPAGFESGDPDSATRSRRESHRRRRHGLLDQLLGGVLGQPRWRASKRAAGSRDLADPEPARWAFRSRPEAQQRGLGQQVASWVGTGQNLPISAEQLLSRSVVTTCRRPVRSSDPRRDGIRRTGGALARSHRPADAEGSDRAGRRSPGGVDRPAREARRLTARGA